MRVWAETSFFENILFFSLFGFCYLSFEQQLHLYYYRAGLGALKKQQRENFLEKLMQ